MKTLNPIRKTSLATALKLTAFAGFFTLAGCASLPPHPELVALQNRFEVVSGLPYASQEAQQELNDTRAALDLGRIAHTDRDEDAVSHYIVVADKNLDIAEARVHLYETRSQIASASEVRERMVREARELDIALAEAEIRAAEADTDAARRLAETRGVELTAQERELARREAEIVAQQRELERQQGELANAEARVNALEREAQDLADRLVEVTTIVNERGTTLVLSDIVFDFDSAELKPGADNALDEIAEFLVSQEDAELKVEGHTDSRGSTGYNMDLSRDRAAAVHNALVARGVPASRITMAGYGEEYPVASNDSDAGRQQNRRVEIVLNDQVGSPLTSRF
jgi:outer membrane protein OmpA-like peptidoglycan-associated protein